jgi:hypothetical protein
MDAFTSLTVPFYKSVAQVLDELKRQEAARIDIELLNVKRKTLAEKRDELLAGAKAASQKDKAHEKDWADQIEVCMREYNRAIEEIATMERRLKKSRPWWKRLLRLR